MSLATTERFYDTSSEWLRALDRELAPERPKPNTALLLMTYEYIERYPNEYNQRIWQHSRMFRETQLCFAGHAARLTGARVHYHPLGRFGWMPKVTTPDGRTMKLDKFAEEALRIDRYQADVLFGEFTNKRLIKDSIRRWTGFNA